MKKIFCILVAIILSPLCLCSCTENEDNNFVNYGGSKADNMMKRLSGGNVNSKSNHGVSKGGVKHGKKTTPQNVTVTKSGIIIYKDDAITNKSDIVDTNFSIGPGDVKFQTGEIRLNY